MTPSSVPPSTSCATRSTRRDRRTHLLPRPVENDRASVPDAVERDVARLLLSCPRFTVMNLGCKVNRVESDSIAASLIDAGGAAVETAHADVIVVNSCTVTGEADKKTRKAVRAALRANPAAEVIVTGCGVAVDAEAYKAIDPRVRAVERAELFSALHENASGALRIGGDFHTRVNVKVQDGCNHACTYCIVHVARGPASSVPFESAVEEAGAYFAKGAKELVLTGIDLGSYRDRGRSLPDLVEAMLEAADAHCPAGERPARIRASSIEPDSIDDRFVELMAQSEGRLCRHLHLPLQSGSTKVLRQMARPYTAERFAELAERLRERVPRIALTTDIICGFPGETDDDFAKTLEVARACRFSKIHVFPYSKRKGTPAAEREDQVPDQVKAERAAALRALSDELRDRDRLSRRGTTELALVQPGMALAESYHEVAVPDGSRLGQLVEVTFDYNG